MVRLYDVNINLGIGVLQARCQQQPNRSTNLHDSLGDRLQQDSMESFFGFGKNNRGKANKRSNVGKFRLSNMIDVIADSPC